MEQASERFINNLSVVSMNYEEKIFVKDCCQNH